MQPEHAEEARLLMSTTGSASGARAAIPRLSELAALYPADFDAQFNLALAVEYSRDKERPLGEWRRLHERFPAELKPLRYLARWLQRASGPAEVLALIEAALPGEPAEADALLEKAELFNELRDPAATAAYFARARDYFRLFIARFPDDFRGKVFFARRLRERGHGLEAVEVLDGLEIDRIDSPASRRFVAETREGIEVLSRRWTRAELAAGDVSCLALERAIETFQDRRAEPAHDGTLGRVALITGSLAAGGAERQMARVGIHLTHAEREGRKVGGITLTAPCHVVVKSLGAADGYDFFLPKVRETEVKTFEIDDMTPEPFEALGIEDPELLALLPFLPPSALYGIRRMVAYFRKEKVQVAYAWQDGAVLFAALAALIAGVPRVVASVRGLPPSIRAHLFHPAYEGMYRALSRVPGVGFSSNSHAAAAAYAHWLDVDPARFRVVYNGVLIPERDEAPKDVERWEKFTRKTRGHDAVTVGGVFRFDIDKRPALWMDFAEAFLARRLDARVVLVGGGRMLPAARETAAARGIADRILFVGTSDDIGFWLKKIDALVLLSRYEGLPNALVEAQLSGIPVVTTPAGGAPEALVEGMTGRVLSSVEDVDIQECCDKVDEVLRWTENDPAVADRIRAFAREQFSTDTMIARTARMLSGDTAEEA